MSIVLGLWVCELVDIKIGFDPFVIAEMVDRLTMVYFSSRPGLNLSEGGRLYQVEASYVSVSCIVAYAMSNKSGMIGGVPTGHQDYKLGALFQADTQYTS